MPLRGVSEKHWDFETSMENLEAAETFFDNKSSIKSVKFTKGVCEYISLWFYLDVSGCSSFLKKIELHKI